LQSPPPPVHLPNGRRGRRLASRARRVLTGRHSACPAPHRLLCPTPLLPLPDETERARALHSPPPLRAAATPLPPLRFLREPRASPSLCFPPESSPPTNSPTTVHLRPIHRTRSIISTSHSDPSFFPANPTLH